MTQNKDIMNNTAVLAEENLEQVTGGNAVHVTGPDGKEYYLGGLDDLDIMKRIMEERFPFIKSR